jgi:hypothetical protein
MSAKAWSSTGESAVRRRGLVVGLVLLAIVASAGCDTHHVAAVQPCPRVASSAVVVATHRGQVGLAKIELTQARLKQLEACK